MRKEFHYHCIRTLAQYAGFDPGEAQIIAYASQYVDDCSEHKPIKIKNVPQELAVKYDGNYFDPVCTAHSGKRALSTLAKYALFYRRPEVQWKVLIPFHFVPAKQATRSHRFSYVVEPGSNLARTIVRQAVDYLKKSSTDLQRLYGLIKLGVALHTFADTWAHQGFSGRHAEENDVDKIVVKRDGKWITPTEANWFVYHLVLDIGHAEAGTLPDMPAVTWRFVYSTEPKHLIERTNYNEFMKAAKTIFWILCDCTNKDAASIWNNLKSRVLSCLKKGDEKAWVEEFSGEIEFNYSRTEWRKQALAGDTVEWDDFTTEAEFRKLSFEYNNDARWFLFHKAAYEQRLFVHARVPQV